MTSKEDRAEDRAKEQAGKLVDWVLQELIHESHAPAPCSWEEYAVDDVDQRTGLGFVDNAAAEALCAKLGLNAAEVADAIGTGPLLLHALRAMEHYELFSDARSRLSLDVGTAAEAALLAESHQLQPKILKYSRCTGMQLLLTLRHASIGEDGSQHIVAQALGLSPVELDGTQYYDRASSFAHEAADAAHDRARSSGITSLHQTHEDPERRPASAPVHNIHKGTVSSRRQCMQLRRHEEQPRGVPKKLHGTREVSSSYASKAPMDKAYGLIWKEFDVRKYEHRIWASKYMRWRKEKNYNIEEAAKLWKELEQTNIFSKQLDQVETALQAAAPSWPALLRVQQQRERKDAEQHNRKDSELKDFRQTKSSRKSFNEFLLRIENDLIKRREHQRKYEQAVRDTGQTSKVLPSEMKPPAVAFKQRSKQSRFQQNASTWSTVSGIKHQGRDQYERKLTREEIDHFVQSQFDFLDQRNRKVERAREKKLEHEIREATLFAEQGLCYPPGFKAPRPI